MLGTEGPIPMFALGPQIAKSDTESNTQFCRWVFRPIKPSLVIRCWGIIALKAELKSTKSTRTRVFVFSRCSRVRWRAVDMASSVEWFGVDMRIAVDRMTGVEGRLCAPWWVLHYYGRECYWSIIIERIDCGFFCNGNDHCSIACWHNSLTQRDVKNICKGMCQLVCTPLKHTVWYLVRACCLILFRAWQTSAGSRHRTCSSCLGVAFIAGMLCSSSKWPKKLLRLFRNIVLSSHGWKAVL